MIASIYERGKLTADRLIEKYGQTAVLVRQNTSGTAYDPTIGTPTRTNVQIVVTSYSDYEVGQGRVQSSDKRVLMAKGDLAVDPTPDDMLEIGGVAHQIVGPDRGNGVKIAAPAGLTMIYELQCRK